MARPPKALRGQQPQVGRRGEATPFLRDVAERATEATEGHGQLDKEKHPTLLALLGHSGRTQKIYGPKLARMKPEQLDKLEERYKRKKPKRRSVDPNTGSLYVGAAVGRPPSMAKRKAS